MTRKFTRSASVLRGIGAFIAVLMVMVALAALAQTQTKGAGRPSGKSHDVFVAPDVGSTERATASGLQAKHSARPDQPYSLSFVAAVSYGSGGPYASGFSIAIADVNGDGKPDLVVAIADFLPTGATGEVGVLLGNGDGTFQTTTTYASGGAFAVSVVVADVNGDGKPDVVVANCAPPAYNYCWTGKSGVGVLLGNGDGTFQPVVTYDSGDGADSVAVADVNGDGKPDLVVANSLGVNVGVLLGNGDGTFQSAVTYDSGGANVAAVAIVDANGDGKLDLVVANYGSDTVGVLLGNGDGTFQPALSSGSGGYVTDAMAIADVNGDGKPDLAVANYCGSSPLNDCSPGEGSVGILLGHGDGTFLPAVTYDSQGSRPTSVAVSDVNGDGKPDVLVANSASSTVGVLLGNGDGTFQPAATFNSGGGGPSSLTVGDVNGDGKPDLVVANPGSPNVSVLLNNSGSPPTTTALVSSLNPAPVPHTVTYTATVTSQDGGTVMGSVMFQDGGLAIATVPLANNQAAYSTRYAKGGSHPITAAYSGDLHDVGSTSATLIEYVASIASKTVVTSSGSPSHVGQPVTFTATVTSQKGAIPDSELVTFYDGAIAIGTGSTASGVATFITSSLTAKTHTIKATYAGDRTIKPSSGTVTQVVNKYATTTTLTSSLNPSHSGQAVTFTARVTSSGPAPTGKVKFLDRTTGIGSATLSGGVAKLTKSTLAVGTHPITAQYLGDAASSASTSSVVNQVVQ